MSQPEGTENLLGMGHQVNSPSEFLLLEFQLICLAVSALLSGWGKKGRVGEVKITTAFCLKEPAWARGAVVPNCAQDVCLGCCKVGRGETEAEASVPAPMSLPRRDSASTALKCGFLPEFCLR